MRITVNGQLSLMMLYVMLCEGLDGAIPVMQNTDGLETRIPRKYADVKIKIHSNVSLIISFGIFFKLIS